MNINNCRALVVYIPVWKGDSNVEDSEELPALLSEAEWVKQLVKGIPIISYDSSFRFVRACCHYCKTSLTRGERYTFMDYKFALARPVGLSVSYDRPCQRVCPCPCNQGAQQTRSECVSSDEKHHNVFITYTHVETVATNWLNWLEGGKDKGGKQSGRATLLNACISCRLVGEKRAGRQPGGAMEMGPQFTPVETNANLEQCRLDLQQRLEEGRGKAAEQARNIFEICLISCRLVG
ncbi:hypothetical protein C8F04DRAFT_1176588 [Mycena alexandri]|uniref:Uncharacterized protein n=1 Tax=Mycena alexandri TaxID=1745969 RepID=A0AAD6XB44_9AGAR|nr:hypothetical protein C8F04DRAFT_1176588 [Mycena alexandri]